jgi:Putative beta-lactamase-inhibitor-like, PepSY-like
MKWTFWLLIPVSLISMTLRGQNVNEDKLPLPVKKAFEQKYPGIKGKWEKEKNNYEVNFKKDDKPMSLVIDPKGNILETERDIPVNELPQVILSYIKTHYNDASITEAAHIVKGDGKIVYEAEVNKKDILFDASGKFLREVNE